MTRQRFVSGRRVAIALFGLVATLAIGCHGDRPYRVRRPPLTDPFATVDGPNRTWYLSGYAGVTAPPNRAPF